MNEPVAAIFKLISSGQVWTNTQIPTFSYNNINGVSSHTFYIRPLNIDVLYIFGCVWEIKTMIEVSQGEVVFLHCKR